MSALALTYLSGADVEALELTDDEILDAVGGVLAAQGRDETVIEPRTHLFPRGADGHFNVLRGAAPRFAGVKVVGDFVANHERGLPSELALLLLMDPMTGVPQAILDATAITEMRTGAVTAIGARHLARAGARVLGHIGARGTAYWNVRLTARVLPARETIRVHSRRPESREAFAEQLRHDLDRPVEVTADWESCVRGADVVVEASRLTEPAALLQTQWIEPGALVIPYGTVSAVELRLTDVMDKIVVDDWGQAGVGPLGALRAHVDTGRLNRAVRNASLRDMSVAGRNGKAAAAAGVGRVVDPAKIDVVAAERAAADLLRAIGADIETPDLQGTPRRVAASLAELLTPVEFNPTTFANEGNYDELVLVRDIPFQSLCMHHLLPFIGHAHVAYLPGDRIIGLSKLARVVDLFARDLQLQERMTVQIADWLDRELSPRGVGVLLSAEHTCMTIRGVRKPGAKTVTSALRGALRDDPRTRQELLSLVG